VKQGPFVAIRNELCFINEAYNERQKAVETMPSYEWIIRVVRGKTKEIYRTPFEWIVVGKRQCCKSSFFWTIEMVEFDGWYPPTMEAHAPLEDGVGTQFRRRLSFFPPEKPDSIIGEEILLE